MTFVHILDQGLLLCRFSTALPGKPLRLVKFTTREVIEEITP
jgi:hypothetical protein